MGWPAAVQPTKRYQLTDAGAQRRPLSGTPMADYVPLPEELPDERYKPMTDKTLREPARLQGRVPAVAVISQLAEHSAGGEPAGGASSGRRVAHRPQHGSDCSPRSGVTLPTDPVRGRASRGGSVGPLGSGPAGGPPRRYCRSCGRWPPATISSRPMRACSRPA